MEKYFIIKTSAGYVTAKKDYFANRLQRQIILNILSERKVFKDNKIKDCLNNYVKGVISTSVNLIDCENNILSSCTDENGIYLVPIFEEKRQLFLSTFYNSAKDYKDKYANKSWSEIYHQIQTINICHS